MRAAVQRASSSEIAAASGGDCVAAAMISPLVAAHHTRRYANRGASRSAGETRLDERMTRHIDFEGIENFRDFGGYDTSHGRPLKRGVLYRSANHAYATDADLQRMAELNLAA